MKDKGLLSCMMNKLASAYIRCTYTHGTHTSRAFTCYCDKHQGMFDHIFYNHENLRVKKLLEIPEEKLLAPAFSQQHNMTDNNFVSRLPNVVYPSSHLRIEAELEFVSY